MSKAKKSYIYKRYVSDLKFKTKKDHIKSSMIITAISGGILAFCIFAKINFGVARSFDDKLASGFFTLLLIGSAIAFLSGVYLLIVSTFGKPSEFKCTNCGESHITLRKLSSKILCKKCNALMQFGGTRNDVIKRKCGYCGSDVFSTNANPDIVCPNCHSLNKIKKGLKIINEDECSNCKSKISKEAWYCKSCNQFIDRTFTEHKIALGAKSIDQYMTFVDKALDFVNDVYSKYENKTPNEFFNTRHFLLDLVLEICAHLKILSDEQGKNRDEWILDKVRNVENIVAQLTEFTKKTKIYDVAARLNTLNKTMNKSIVPLFKDAGLKEWNFKKHKVN